MCGFSHIVGGHILPKRTFDFCLVVSVERLEKLEGNLS